VEFWATWCGPCKVTIPHLSALQKKYPKVKFVGVSVWEEDPSAVKPFVREMGDKMEYSVAMDIVPPGMGGSDGLMAKNWMLAAGQMGIPTAFIVNKDNRIAWIGHPMAMEEPLRRVASGTWDINSARAKTEKQQVNSRKILALSQKLQKASRAGDVNQMIAILGEAIAEDPSLEPQVGLRKFALLLKDSDKDDKAADYGHHLIDETFRDDAAKLNLLAWTVVDPARQSPLKESKLAAMALKAALRADSIADGKDGAIADTLGRAYFIMGDIAKALEAQERAIKHVKGTQFEQDPDIPKRLEEYRRAAGK
jgi:hypothetical protein